MIGSGIQKLKGGAQTQDTDRVNLLLFFQKKESRLKKGREQWKKKRINRSEGRKREPQYKRNKLRI
jgi:hypothetical protein